MHSEEESPETIVFPERLASVETVMRRRRRFKILVFVSRVILALTLAMAAGLALADNGIGTPAWLFPVIVSVVLTIVFLCGLIVWHFIPKEESDGDSYWQMIISIVAAVAAVAFTVVVYDDWLEQSLPVAASVVAFPVLGSLIILLALGVPRKYDALRVFAWAVLHIAVALLAISLFLWAESWFTMVLVLVVVPSATVSLFWVFMEYVEDGRQEEQSLPE